MTFLTVVLCFFLSGFAALLYQIAWLRQFSIVFGTAELAVAAVLAAYMGGLAIGSAIAGRYLHRINRPVLTYGILEGGIAAAALLVPNLLGAASAVFIFILGDKPHPPASSGVGQSLFYLVAAFLVLGLPTAFMGATLPLLTKYAIRSDKDIGPRVALLYGINTAGAVIGAVAAAFLILPALGMRGTVWVGISVNLAVFVIAWQLDNKTRSAAVPVAGISTWSSNRFGISFSDRQTWILPAMAISGAIAFTYEVLWTRLLNHVLGGSIYAFATMVASFLAGIAIGSGLSGTIAKDRQRSADYFVVSQSLIAITSIFVFNWIDDMIPESTGLIANAIFAVVVMLPSTIFIGATFPLAVRILSDGQPDVGASTAYVYAWNTVGAISGAIAAGFYIIPALGFTGTIKLATAGNLAVALLVICVLRRRRLAYGAAVGAVIISIVLVFDPRTPAAVLHSSPLTAADPWQERELFFAVGRSSTVLLVEKGGAFDLRTNGLPESRVFSRGSPPIRNVQRWLTALPVIARPDTQTMCVIGLGAGVALEGIPPSVTEVDVIELEEEVINANRIISDKRKVDPLALPFVNVIINDARNALSLTYKKYDAIVSQPSHPWTSGASHLYTREFLELAKKRLHEGGIFVQWMNSRFVDESLLKSLAATMDTVYQYVRLYQPDPGVLFFLGSDSPLNIERQLIQLNGQPISEYRLHFSSLGINSVEDVLLSMAMDDAGLSRFSESAKPVTDDDNRMATRSKLFGDGLAADGLSELIAPYDPLLDVNSWVFEDLDDIDFAYLVSSMIRLQFTARADRLKNIVPDQSTSMLIDAMLSSQSGREDQANNYYISAYRKDPYDVTLQYLLVRRYLGRLAQGNAPADIVKIAGNFEGPPAAVVKGWTYGLVGNWRSLAQLDSVLAQSTPTDSWYVDAALLRAEWRTKVVVRGDNRYAREALSFVDRALLLGPSLDLYVLRATSAILLKDRDTTVETIRSMASHVRDLMVRLNNGEYIISKSGLEALLVRLNTFKNELDKPFYDQVDSSNDEVKTTIVDLLLDIRAQLEQ